MSLALTIFASACLDLGVALDVSHVAGERKVDADGLSRLSHPDHHVPSSEMQAKFNAGNGGSIALDELLEPWRKLIGRPRLA